MLLLCSLVMFTACSKDDEPGEGGSGSGKGSVKITSITKGNKVSGKYTYRVSVKASGVSASEVKDIGISWGKTSAATGSVSSTRQTLSTTRVISLSSNTTYYIQPYIYTSSGKKTGSKERVKVPS